MVLGGLTQCPRPVRLVAQASRNFRSSHRQVWAATQRVQARPWRDSEPLSCHRDKILALQGRGGLRIVWSDLSLALR